MDVLFPNRLKQQIEAARQNQLSLDDAVHRRKEWPHQTLAVATLEHWNIPEAIVHPLRLRHDENTQGSRFSADLEWVQMCALLAQGLGVSYLDDIVLPRPYGQSDQPLGKDLVELFPAVEGGYAMYREMRQNLL